MSFIAGLVFREVQANPAAGRDSARALVATGSGRGADDAGESGDVRHGLACRSLRTLDLTPDGAQPARSADRHYAVVLDGYIANGAALRRELEDAKISLRGHGDAELVAAGASCFGLNRLVQKIEGAFALILWDATDQALHLVRDRMGARPLYAAVTKKAVACASDYRAFAALDGFTPALSPDAAGCYLAWGHIIPPLSPWKGVISLPPGHRLMIRADDASLPAPEAYWSAASVLEESALRGHHSAGDPLPLERVSIALAAEAVRIDVSYTLLDDASPAASVLRARLDRFHDRHARTLVLSAPDGPALQMGFEHLSRLPEPVSDPAAPAWVAALRHAGGDTPVLLVPAGLARPELESEHDTRIRRFFERIPSFLRRFAPPKYAHLMQDARDLYAARFGHWQGLYEFPGTIEPRIDQSPAQRLIFYEFCRGFSAGWLPAGDRIAASFNLDLRAPMADARLFDFGLPVAPAQSASDVEIWLRGPLRPRMEELLKSAALDELGLGDAGRFTGDWQAFLAGDSGPARRLWTLATLLAWTKAQAQGKVKS